MSAYSATGRLSDNAISLLINKGMRNRIIGIGIILLTAGITQEAEAQRLLSLDSCRAMALRNNKQMSVARVKQEVAANLRKSARTKYLPHISALGGYEWTSKEISLLSDDQKSALPNVGTTLSTAAGGQAKEAMGQIPPATWQSLGMLGITPEALQQQLGSVMGQLGSLGNGFGQRVVDALHTDTRNMFAGAVMLTQPVFMGGAIVAMNKMADLGEELAANSAESKRQLTLYTIDQAYWQVVSLRHKQKLAEAYLDLVRKLDSDVQKMIREGVATRSEGLSVAVKVNEAEMMLTKVNDGLVLSRMLLCQALWSPSCRAGDAGRRREQRVVSGPGKARSQYGAGEGESSRTEAAAEHGGYQSSGHELAEGRQSASGVADRRLCHVQSECVQRFPA